MKRYKLGQRRTKTDAYGNSAAMPDMIECENGEYIKYSEYEQLLESIGAGGVSGQRITKADDSDDYNLRFILHVYDNAMQKAFDGRAFSNPCNPGTLEAKAWELGTKEGTRKRNAGAPNSISIPAASSEPVGVLECHASGDGTFHPDERKVFMLPVGEYPLYTSPVPDEVQPCADSQP